MSDQVEHPTHYNHLLRRECWDEMIDRYGAQWTVCFDIMSAYKYIYRAGTKPGQDGDTDLSKAVNYLKHAKKLIIEELDGEECTDALWKLKETLALLEETL